MRVALYGIRGRVGSVLAPALEAAGHEVADADPAGCEAAVTGKALYEKTLKLSQVTRG